MSILAVRSIERYGIGLHFAERRPVARGWRRPNRSRVCESDQRGRTRQGRSGHGTAGASSARAVGNDQFVIHHGSEDVVADQLDLLDFVTGTEAVEEVDEWYPRLERCSVGDDRQIQSPDAPTPESDPGRDRGHRQGLAFREETH